VALEKFPANRKELKKRARKFFIAPLFFSKALSDFQASTLAPYRIPISHPS